jgi:hypothetical protein
MALDLMFIIGGHATRGLRAHKGVSSTSCTLETSSSNKVRSTFPIITSSI